MLTCISQASLNVTLSFPECVSCADMVISVLPNIYVTLKERLSGGVWKHTGPFN